MAGFLSRPLRAVSPLPLSPAICPGFPAKPVKGPVHLFPFRPGQRDRWAGSSLENTPESHVVWMLGKQLQKSQQPVALGDTCHQSPWPLSAGCTSHPALCPGGLPAEWHWGPSTVFSGGPQEGRGGRRAQARPCHSTSRWPWDHKCVLMATFSPPVK